jgi:hypothetical protein
MPVGRNWRKTMMKMKISTRDMLVVAKNSTTLLAAWGISGKAISRDPEPMID